MKAYIFRINMEKLQGNNKYWNHDVVTVGMGWEEKNREVIYKELQTIVCNLYFHKAILKEDLNKYGIVYRCNKAELGKYIYYIILFSRLLWSWYFMIRNKDF